MSQLPEIVQALLNPTIYPEASSAVEMMQTQMSFVFLVGDFVYKVKKPVNLGYLDYTTLDKRHFFCQKEVELNQRLCPDTYLGVVPIVKKKGNISIGGQGEIIEYAVKMRYLPQERMLNVLLAGNRVSAEMLTAMARTLLRETEQPQQTYDEDLDGFDRKVLGTFTTPDGRIKAFPVQEKKFLVLLRHVLKAFEPGVRYTEKRVNQVLAEFNQDTAKMRRALVDHHLMAREGGGGKYWRIDR